MEYRELRWTESIIFVRNMEEADPCVFLPLQIRRWRESISLDLYLINSAHYVYWTVHHLDS